MMTVLAAGASAQDYDSLTDRRPWVRPLDQMGIHRGFSLATVVAAVSLGSSALAQPGPGAAPTGDGALDDYFSGGGGPGESSEFLRNQPVMQALDVDGDSEISAAEIETAVESLLGLDSNGNGALEYGEISGRGNAPGPFTGWLRMLTATRIIDRSGDSEISAEELADAPAQLRRLDRDTNFSLTPNELDDSRRVTILGGRPSEDGEGLFVGGVLNNQDEVPEQILPGEDDRQFRGYLLFMVTGIAADVQLDNTVYLLDPDGNIAHTWDAHEPGAPEVASVWLLENGTLLRQQPIGDYLDLEGTQVGSYGILQLVDWDGKVLWEYERCIVGQHCLHHDMKPMPNGNILAMAHVAFSRDEVMHWGATDSAPTVQFEQVLELKPNLDDGSTEIVWMWNSWDHIVQDVDPNKPNYGIVHEEVGKHDINQRRLGREHLHMNSVDYHPERDLIMLSAPRASEIWLIDHSTTTDEAAGSTGGRHGKGGDFIYRWGNPAAYDRGAPGERILGGQHDARWLLDRPGAGGNITIHNNSAGQIPGAPDPISWNLGTRYSSALEVAVPFNSDGFIERESGRPFKGEITWQYQAYPDSTWFSPFMSAVERLPNGNTLITNSHNMRIFEVTPDGEIVMDFVLERLLPEELGRSGGRIWRAFKLPIDYPGLAGRL